MSGGLHFGKALIRGNPGLRQANNATQNPDMIHELQVPFGFLIDRADRDVQDGSMPILSQHIVIVTGKGGVGKSTVSAAIATRAAKAGKKVLLVEFGEESFLGPFLGVDGVSSEPKNVPALGFQVAIWDTASCLREYVLHFIKIQSLFKIFFENRVMQAFINVAPALKELALLGKLTSGERHVGPAFKYDLVVVDGYASGHMLALLRAPKGMADVIRAGPMGYHSDQIYKVLTDPKITSYVVVTLSDELPTVEALELSQTLRTEFGIQPQVFMNRCLESPVPFEEVIKIAESEGPKSGLGTFARYLGSTLQRQDKNFERLKAQIPDTIKVALFHRFAAGSKMVKAMSEVLPE